MSLYVEATSQKESRDLPFNWHLRTYDPSTGVPV